MGIIRRRKPAPVIETGKRARSSAKKRKWRKALRVGAIATIAVVAVSGVLVAYAAITLPSLDNIGQATGTIRLVDRNGKLIAEVGHDARTVTTVPLSQVAQVLQDATIAAEDRGFYSEGAFDLKRIGKAFFDDIILHSPAEGASTITQQLAKQAFFGPNAEKSPLRKLQEALLANELDSRYTKQQILEKYLNLIYYGENAYGIENASQRYFGKHASALTLPEAALLAGLPEAPSYNDPYQNSAAAFARMHYVLDSLVAVGKIKQSDADAVDPLNSDPVKQKANQALLLADMRNGHVQLIGPAPHFAQYIQNQLSQQFADDPSVLNGTLTVTTTMDLDIQQKANAAIGYGITKIGASANNAAILAVDSHTGDILAMVGSADFTKASIAGQFNVTTALRQPGSTFKPYVYTEAFRTGTIKPDTIVDDTAAEAAKVGGTHDWDNRYLGQMTAARALLLSRNVPAQETMVATGIGNVISFAHQMGITSDIADNVSSAIGSSSVSMIDQASAYSAFSNGGHKVVARGILKVADQDGNVLLDNTQPASHGDVISAAEAYTTTKILLHYGQVWGIHFNVPVAGKSGTTDNLVDAQFMAYTPDMVVAAWAGHTEQDNPAEIPMTAVYGVYTGQWITATFINSLHLQAKNFPAAAGALSDCNPGDADISDQTGCQNITPTPSPSPTPTASPSPTPSSSPGGTPPPIVLSPAPTPTPSPTPVPTPTPTPTICPIPPPTGC